MSCAAAVALVVVTVGLAVRKRHGWLREGTISLTHDRQSPHACAWAYREGKIFFGVLNDVRHPPRMRKASLYYPS